MADSWEDLPDVKPASDWEALPDATPSEHRSDAGGIKRLELHKVAPDTSDAEPVKSRDEDLLDKVAQYFKPKSTTGAFAEGVNKGATLGFGDELYGALGADSKMMEQRQHISDDVDEAKRKGTYDPGAAIDPIPQTKYQLKREGQPTQTLVRPAASLNDTQGPDSQTWTQAYQNARDSLRQDYKTAEKEHPVAFGAGEFAGSAALPLPGPGKAKGLAKVGQYAIQGAGVGTAAGLGNSDADLTSGKWGDAGAALLDTVGGGLGGAFAGGVLGAGAAAVDPALERMAQRKAYKALDPYMKTIQATLREQLGRDASPAEVMGEVERLGKRALDEGVIPHGKLERWATSETLGNRAAAARDEAGVLKGGFVDMAQDQLGGQPVRPMRMAREIDAEATKAATNEATRPLAKALQREANEVRGAAADRVLAGQPLNRTLPEAEKTKTALQSAVFGLDAARRGGPAQQAKEIVARLAKEQAERAIEQGLGPEDLAQFQALKGKYGDLAKIAQTAAHGSIRDFRNQSVGLGDKLAAQVGAHAASGGAAIPAAIATGAAHHVVNHRGASALARTLSTASQSSDLLAPAATWEQFLHKDDEEQK